MVRGFLKVDVEILFCVTGNVMNDEDKGVGGLMVNKLIINNMWKLFEEKY